jgi:hypothetical protein
MELLKDGIKYYRKYKKEVICLMIIRKRLLKYFQIDIIISQKIHSNFYQIKEFNLELIV